MQAVDFSRVRGQPAPCRSRKLCNPAASIHRPMHPTRPIGFPRLRRKVHIGFTLIELMVVLVIIGVLAALIVPNVLDRADDARVTAARTDVNNLVQALKLYKPRQPALPDRRSKACRRFSTRPTDEPDTRPTGSRIVEKLPNDPWGAHLPVPEPRHQGRDRCDVVRRRWPGGRRRQERRHRKLAVVATAPRSGNTRRLNHLSPP